MRKVAFEPCPGRANAPQESPADPEFAEIDAALTDFFQQSKGGLLGQTNLWVGVNPSANEFFNTESAYFLNPRAPASGYVERFIPRPRNRQLAPPFQPFAVKLQVEEGAEIYFHADCTATFAL